MNNRLHFLNYLLIMVVAAFLGSCDHIELESETAVRRTKVDIVFDWSGEPDASPSEMIVYFFRLGETGDNARPKPRSNVKYTFEFLGKEGGTISLPPGVYGAICHNNDSDRHGFVGHDSYDEFGLRLSDLDRSSSTKNDDTERVAHTPDGIWCSSIPVVVIGDPELEVKSGDRQTVTFAMQSVVQQLTFIIHHPINFTSATRLNAAITGMAGTVHPGRGMTGEETVTHSFSMSADGTGKVIGHITAFGHCGGKPVGTRQSDGVTKTHMLHLTDGTGWVSSHDVTERMHGYEGAEEIIVELDSVVIPPAHGTPGGGFTPTVGEWQGSQEIIGM